VNKEHITTQFTVVEDFGDRMQAGSCAALS